MARKVKKAVVMGVALAALLLFGTLGTGQTNPQAAQDKPVKITGDLKPPKLIKAVDPVYPEEARKNRIDGIVILEATVDVNGKVQEVKVLRGVEGLNQAATDAVKQWVYEPMTIEGKPRPVIFTVTVNFKLKDKAPKAGVEGGVVGGVAGGVEGGVTGGVAGGVAGAVKAEGDIKPPTLIKMVDPVYPEEARKQGIEGLVILEATVDVKGQVQDVKVVRPVPALNQAAIDAVKQWVYEPKIIDGKPTPVTFTVTVNFKLKTK